MMDPIKGAIIGMIGVPLAIGVLALMVRHPMESLGIFAIFAVLVAAGVYEIHQRERAPAVELDAADTAKAQQEAARYAALDAWKPKADSEIEGQWPASKPVAKHVRHPSGVGLKLNRD